MGMAAASTILSDLSRRVRDAVRCYWQTRTKQLEKQAGSGAKDQGLRSAVTGGAKMDGFITLLTRLLIQKFAQSLVAQAAAFSGRIKEL